MPNDFTIRKEALLKSLDELKIAIEKFQQEDCNNYNAIEKLSNASNSFCDETMLFAHCMHNKLKK